MAKNRNTPKGAQKKPKKAAPVGVASPVKPSKGRVGNAGSGIAATAKAPERWTLLMNSKFKKKMVRVKDLDGRR